MAISTATVKAFCNTGFDLNNIPDNPSLLNSAATSVVTLETLNCLPLSGKNTGSITVRTFAQLPQVDYMSLYFPQDGTTYYVTNIEYEYISLDTVKIDFTIDAWLTAGGLTNISKISGITKRHHVSDDTFGEYTMPDEMLVPSKPLKCATSDMLGDHTTSSQPDLTVVVSTIDLFVLGRVDANGKYIWAADAGVDYESDNNAVCVPIVPNITEDQFCTIKILGFSSNAHEIVQPGVAYFNGDNEDVQRGIAMARSLGIEDSILYQYTVPGDYIFSVDFYVPTTYPALNYGTSLFSAITSYGGSNYFLPFIPGAGSKLNLEYDTVMNKRVLTGELNAYHLVAAATGEEIEINPEDWAPSNILPPIFPVQITFDMGVKPCFDPRPTGRPMYHPLLKNTPAESYISSVRGEQWATAPIKYQQASGIDLTVDKFNNKRYEDALNFKVSTEKAYAGALAGMVGGTANSYISGGGIPILSGIVNADVTDFNVKMDTTAYQGSRAVEKAAFYMDNMIVAPQLNFPRSETVRDIVGNGFIIWRNYLDPDDVDRLDVILNMYGYKDVKKLEKSDFTNRQYYNYVEAGDVKISYTNAVNKRIVELAESQVEAGVRVWHRKPDTALFNKTNPVAS